jgi:hypothetical protein
MLARVPEFDLFRAVLCFAILKGVVFESQRP